MREEAATAYSIELTPPDLSGYRQGNCGLDYLHSWESAMPGPHVMVSALVHGNELCGAIALDRLLREGIRPRRGRLTLAFVNVAAYRRFDPAQPFATRYVDEDFNRLWSAEVLDGGGETVERRRARALRPMVESVDLLLDIHSMQHKTKPLMMAGPLPKGRALARAVGWPATVVTDAGHEAGVRLRDFAGFADPASPRNALLVECGQHWEQNAAVVALDVALRFLMHLDVVTEAWADPLLTERDAAPQRFIEVTEAVTVRTESFAFVEDYSGLDPVPKAGTLFAHDGGRPVTTPYDDCVLIMPSRRAKPGETAVRLGREVAAE